MTRKGGPDRSEVTSNQGYTSNVKDYTDHSRQPVRSNDDALLGGRNGISNSVADQVVVGKIVDVPKGGTKS